MSRSDVLIDGLESRTLMSVSPLFRFPWPTPQPPSDAVVADLAAMKADQQKLAADRLALAPTLEADRQAIADAIKALDSQVAPLRTELQKDIQAAQTTLQADFKQLLADRGNTDAVKADQAKLKTDLTAARTEIQGDIKAIQDLINNNQAVKDARAKLASDAKPITDDLAKLQADYQQLAADIRAQRDGTGGGGTTTTTV